ncbi:MAG: hypothetical protein JXA42_02070 [Anaerolineales bacterium]|nr:hypothetical protein [Anaerolineales bacterium]
MDDQDARILVAILINAAPYQRNIMVGDELVSVVLFSVGIVCRCIPLIYC